MKEYLDFYGISEEIYNMKNEHVKKLQDKYEKIDKIREQNIFKVLSAMQECRLSETHFNWVTGYGYDDMGRDKTEEIYSKIFRTEDALVRTQIVNGTHAITLGLRGISRAGDRIVFASGKPYDTLQQSIGLTGPNGASIMEMGVECKFVELLPKGVIDIDGVMAEINDKTTVVYIQRSSGYAPRPAICIDMIEKTIKTIKDKYPQMLVMVDNCYGEFVEEREPSEVGADLIAGSLFKNPGGTLALSGGYLAGKEFIIKRCAQFLTTPGIKKECGLTFGQTRTILQGLFFSPTIVSSAVKSSILCASIFKEAGFPVFPDVDDMRSDIVQVVQLGSPEKILAFCKGIQEAAAVDSFATPIASDMPSYKNQLIMASGSFVQGSTIELSADGPVREPYAVYFQGAAFQEHGQLGIMMAYKYVMAEKR